ncbi:MAG TPA: thioesterase family protein [Kofleriaceae bacterium]|jgi:acyl-CoA thioesterase|nr:thioesterase family protein [Kofleriaceae bacterium]
MASLSDVCTPRPAGDHYQLDVIDGWRMGRGAFGGLVVGALINAIEQRVADPTRRVRSVTAELPGPVEVGTVDIAVDTLRRGNNVSTVRAALAQHGEIRSHAVAVVAAARAAGGAEPIGWNDLAPPEIPAWTELAAMAIDRPGGRPGAWPEFAQHFEYWPVESPGGHPRLLGWVRARNPGPRRDAALIAALIDAWWPVTFSRLGPRPMATIAFTLDIAGGLDGLDPDAPLLYRATAPVCTDGYALETRELWGIDGRLVAINHQTFVIIR